MHNFIALTKQLKQVQAAYERAVQAGDAYRANDLREERDSLRAAVRRVAGK